VPTVEPNSATGDAVETEFLELRIAKLRKAVRNNQVSFPSQVPAFPKHDRPDLQQKLVQLYFVRGWNCREIGGRYGLSPQRVQQILNTWKKRAVELGCIQGIPPAESLQRVAERPPIQVVLSEVVGSPAAPALEQFSAWRPGVAPLEEDAVPDGIAPWTRPRRRLDFELPAGLAKQLQAAAQMEQPSERQLTPETEEMRTLRKENARLKKLLARLAAGEKTLMTSITKSNGARA